MKKLASLTICICASAVFAMFTLNTIADHHGTKTEQTSNFEKNWHYWRGPHSTGMAVNANPPTTWSETENIRWKVRIPGLGHATPIIWEDMIFIQTAIEGEMPETESAEGENTSEESQSERRRNRRKRNRTIPHISSISLR